MDMQLFGAYIPLDRRHALANGYELANRTKGAALFADVSGFTPLTEALANERGARRGAEELTQTLNTVYSALIQNVHLYYGSVIGFAGDAITCWFENDDGLRAVSSALAMQAAMNDFRHVQTPGGQAVELAIKTAVAIGPVRRFLVGDPRIQVMDVLAGDTLSQMAAAEHLAERNEVVVTAVVAQKLGDQLAISDPLHDEKGHTYHLVTDLNTPITLPPWPQLPPDALSLEQMRPWLLPPVFNQLATGQDSFLAELRPAVIIFLYFDGIDYDGDDDAGDKLDLYVRWVQNVLAKYEGNLLQLIMGDKGSYLYAAFGAPLAHGDDAARAVAAALELRQPLASLSFIRETKIGISVGRFRAGAYGSPTRQTYGVLGEAVNTAARLMEAAGLSQVLVSPAIIEATRKQFTFRSVGELKLKGKTETLAVSEVIGHNIQAIQPTMVSLPPLMGREPEMAGIGAQLQAVHQGHGRVLRISGAAGIGKSHLALAVAGQARQLGWQAWLSACQSTTQTTPYFVWRQVFRALFALDETLEGNVAQQIEKVSTAVGQTNPEWSLRLPLLGDLLGLPIPDNQATAAFDPRLRQESLITLAIDILHHHADQAPLLLFVDDAQWMDEASQSFTLNLARTLENYPIYLLLMHRPPLDSEREILPELDNLPLQHTLELSELTPEAVTMLAAYLLGGSISPLLDEVIQSLAQGNPFFTEELLTSLQEGGQLQQVRRERGAQWELADHVFDALRDANCLVKKEGEWRLAEDVSLSAAALGLPDSIYGLVLSRLDRLAEEHRLTLKVASVIGRLFEFDLLNFAHPMHPTASTLLAEIRSIENRDFIRLEQPDPRLTYTFKHSTTQEVVYETLLFAQRRELHRTIATWYEMPSDQEGKTLANFYPLLAYHWRYAEDKGKERHYALLAGEQAAAQYANEDALRYFSRALELTPAEEVAARYRLLLGREAVYGLTAQREPQAADLESLSQLVTHLTDPTAQIQVLMRKAKYAEAVSDFARSEQEARQAQALAMEIENYALAVDAAVDVGQALWRQGKIKEAEQILTFALNISKNQSAENNARIYLNLGIVYSMAHEPQKAQSVWESALQEQIELGDLKAQASILTNLANSYYLAGAYLSSRQLSEQARTICRQIGDLRIETHILANLGSIYHALGLLSEAKNSHLQALQKRKVMEDRAGQSLDSYNVSLVLHDLQGYEEAYYHSQHANQIDKEIGDKFGQAYSTTAVALSLEGLQRFNEAREKFLQGWELQKELGQPSLTLDTVAGLVRLAQKANDQENLAQWFAIGQEILGKNPLAALDHPAQVAVTMYEAGAQLGLEEEVMTYITEALTIIKERGEQIEEEAIRKQYYQALPANQAILALEASLGLAGELAKSF